MDNVTYRILVINPGSTSTKVSLFENERRVFERSVFHEASVLLAFPTVNDQMPFRRKVVLDMMEAEGVQLSSVDAFVGRGGSAHTQPGGITRIDRRLYDDTVAAVDGSEHPAKLGVMLAWVLAQECGRPAFTLDPTNVDEFCDYARLTGIKGVYRSSHSHVLNQKAVASFHAAKLGRRYEDCNFIVAHIDGGITVSAHERGRMVDGNMGADGEGAFSPTRIGSVPVMQLLDYLETHPNLEAATRQRYQYEAYAQFVAPLACLVITLFAIPMGIATGRQSVFKGIVGALCMFFAFYGLTILCMILAARGLLAPLPAACIPDLVFFAIGCRLFWKNR